MVECPLNPTYPSSGQGGKLKSLPPTHNSEYGYSSPPILEQEISYHQLRLVHPITR